MAELREMIGERIKSLRTTKKYSQEELAFRANINASQLSKMERGVANFTVDSLSKILVALDVPYSLFFQFESAPPVIDDPIIEKTITSMRNMVVEEQKCVYEVVRLLENKNRKKKRKE